VDEESEHLAAGGCNSEKVTVERGQSRDERKSNNPPFSGVVSGSKMLAKIGRFWRGNENANSRSLSHLNCRLTATKKAAYADTADTTQKSAPLQRKTRDFSVALRNWLYVIWGGGLAPVSQTGVAILVQTKVRRAGIKENAPGI
jgi:hypothetical protein